MQIRVYYEDTDAGGVVYYADYLKYFERGRTEYFRERGLEVASYAAAGILFVVAHAEIDYRLAARYNDLLDMETEVVDFSRASLTFSHLIRLHGTDRVVVEGWVRLVCVVLSSFLCEFLKPGEGARDLPQGRLLPSQFHFQRNKSQ